MNRELQVPLRAACAPDSFEILRIWAAEGSQHVTIRSDLRGGASGFGMLLGQLAQHGALLYAERDGIPLELALEEILRALEMEVDVPNPTLSGSIDEGM